MASSACLRPTRTVARLGAQHAPTGDARFTARRCAGAILRAPRRAERIRGKMKTMSPADAVNLISRADAANKIRQHWLDTYTKEQLLATYEPEWERLRNYEFEDRLTKTFGDEWCI